jgi:hypothetical protein
VTTAPPVPVCRDRPPRSTTATVMLGTAAKAPWADLTLGGHSTQAAS